MKLKRLFTGLAAVLGIAMVGSVGLVAAAPAQAADVTSTVTFSNLTFVGDPPTLKNTPFNVSVDWSVPDNTVHAGDSFTFTFPVGVQGYGSTFLMKSETGETVANCTVVNSVFTCTFTDFVDTNPLNIHGAMQMALQFTETREPGDVTLIVKGDADYKLPIPGGIGGGTQGSYQQTPTMVKDGLVNSNGSILWNINLPVQQATDAQGKDIVFTDVMDSRLSFGPLTPTVDIWFWYRDSAHPSFTTVPVGTGPGQVSYTKKDDHTLEFVFHDALASFAPDTTLSVQYNAFAPAGTANGTVFKNTVTGMTTVEHSLAYITSGGNGTGDPVGRIAITKVDSKDPSRRLAGAQYEVRDASNTLVATLTTKADGTVDLGMLTPGTYTVKESVAPDGYKLDPTVYTYQITAGQLTDITYSDEILTGSVAVKKVDAADGTTGLAGAVFEVRDSSGAKVSMVGPTVADGSAVASKIVPGDYSLVEVTAPAGYDLNPTPLPVTVTAGQNSPVAYTFQDTKSAPATGAVSVVKRDAADASRTLSGAVFELRDGSGAVVETVGPTAADGSATKSGIPAGDYLLVETKAPAGYTVNAAATPVTVTAGETSPVPVVVQDVAVVTPPVPTDTATPKDPSGPKDSGKPAGPAASGPRVATGGDAAREAGNDIAPFGALVVVGLLLGLALLVTRRKPVSSDS